MSIRNRKILVIDDSRFSRWTLKQEIEKLGGITMEASHAEDGLHMIDAEKPDAVILDLLMPGVSGIEMLDRLKKSDGYHPPVVVLTADVQKSTYEKCRELGARAFLKKPINTSDLESTLEGFFND